MAAVKKKRKAATRKKAAPKKRKKVAAPKKRAAVRRKPAVKRKVTARKTAAPRKKATRKKRAIKGGQWKGIHNDWESIPRHTRRVKRKANPKSRTDAWLRKKKIGAVIHNSPHGVMAVLSQLKRPF